MSRCNRGHELTDDNVSWQLTGKGTPFRMCRTCNRERAKLWRQKNRGRLERVWSSAGQTLKKEARE